MRISDWSSDVCSSDLAARLAVGVEEGRLGDLQVAAPAVEIDLLVGSHRLALLQHPAVAEREPLGGALAEDGGIVEADHRLRAARHRLREGGIDRKSTRLNSSH